MGRNVDNPNHDTTLFAANQTRLLHDLLGVVDLRNISHKNICCQNTVTFASIFAYTNSIGFTYYYKG